MEPLTNSGGNFIKLGCHFTIKVVDQYIRLKIIINGANLNDKFIKIGRTNNN